MSAADTLEHLTVATLGEQAAAVIAPLLSERLAVPSSEVLLVGTARTRDAGVDERVRDALVERGRHVTVVTNRGATALADETRKIVRERGRGRSALFLVNGGTLPLVRALLACLRESALGVELVTSRDHRGYTVAMDGSVEPFDVAAIPLDRLLDILDVEFDPQRRRLAHRGGEHWLDGVDILERAGQLFARIDASNWDVHKYRRNVLIRRRLLRLGLDARRVFLVNVPRRVDKLRAAEDGVPFAGALNGLTAEAWPELVASGEMIDAAERIRTERATHERVPLAPVAGRGEGWTSGTLITIMGTQPGMTLRAIWRHRPAFAVIVYDDDHPLTTEHVLRLIEQPARPPILAWRLSDLPDLTPALAPLNVPDEALLDLTPGDKLTAIRLDLWGEARSEPPEVWEPKSPAERDRGRVPLKTWIALHSPVAVESAAPPHAGLEHDVAIALLDAVLRTEELDDLANLAERRAHPRVEGGRLMLPADVSYELEQLGELGKQLAEPRGNWFELATAGGLTKAGIDEVLAPVVAAPPPGARWWRDELDVVTAHGGQYCYWSCKAGKPAALEDELTGHIIEARAQADRLLGWNRPAVVVVPRLDALSMKRLDRVGVGWWHDGEFDIDVVDVRLILDRGRVRKLASRSSR